MHYYHHFEGEEKERRPHGGEMRGCRGRGDGMRCHGRPPMGGMHGPCPRPHGGRPPFPPMPEDDGSLTSLLFRCAHAMRRPDGRRGDSQQRVLRILSWRDEMSSRELQDHMHIRPGSLSELISKLEGKGLVQRERGEDDRRTVMLWLTPEGREAADRVPSPQDRDARFAALDAQERETLRGLLQKLLDSAEK